MKVLHLLSQTQNNIIYLMFLNGIVFLGLNFIAYSIIFPGNKTSKRIGYVLIVAVCLAYGVMQEFQILKDLEFPEDWIGKIIIGGFVIPVFFISLAYYRIKKSRIEKNTLK